MRQLFSLLMLGLLLVSFSSPAVSADSGAACCLGTRGNADGDPGEGVDISDLQVYIDYLFFGASAAQCLEEFDAVGNDASIDISDLQAIVDFLFFGGALEDCPPAAHIVFQDNYGSKVTYAAFAGSKLDAVQISVDSIYAGSQGLVVTIPGSAPWWSGGAFVDSGSVGRDLSGFNALTFWAKASQAATLDVIGLGNDNSGTSKYTAEMTALPLTTAWQKYVIPIPLASKLTAENGLFYFAEGEGADYQIWVDEIIFENLGTITNPRPTIGTQTIDVQEGSILNPSNGSVIFAVDGNDVTVSAKPGYFTFVSSNPAVVSVGLDGVITAEATGTATLTATLGVVAATGTITVNVTSAEAVPGAAAPTPTKHPDSVVALFSDAYTSATVDTWSAGWDQADVADYTIGADNLKKYTNLVFAGIEFASIPLDASSATHFHMDVWTPNATAAPAVFKVKLVDFGANGVYGGGDDVEHELTFDETTMNTGSWVSIDLPLASFTGLTTKAHLAQMVISGDLPTVYLDNIYFYDSGMPTIPLIPAPTPTLDASYVVSLYSDAYTPAATVDTWSAVWDQADVADYLVGSDNTKRYTSLVFAGIEFTSATLNASAMTHFHMDVWTPNLTAAPAVFKIKLVDFGANGVWGGGDDVEHELTFDHTFLSTGAWVGLDVPFSSFTNLTTRGHLAQMIISGDLSTIYIDNIYCYVPAPTAPPSSAPTPALGAADVVSLFSDAYTNATVDTWSAGWDMADVADYTIGADNLKQYTNLTFAGIEFTSSTIDASVMTHFHMDVWTPDVTAAPAVFKVKLVDFGANGVWGGGDDVEHELTFDESTMNTGSWVSIEVPLSAFAGLTTKGHLAQMIISSDPNTVFVDNIYFHK